MTLPQAKLLLAALVAAVVLAACWPAADSGDKLAGLKAMPEAALAYPGSVQLSERGSQENTEAQADYGRMLGTQASLQQVHDYFNSKLAASGWTVTYCFAGAEIEITCYRWTKAAAEFRLGFWETKDPYHMLHDWPSRYATIYQIDLLAEPAGWSPTPKR